MKIIEAAAATTTMAPDFPFDPFVDQLFDGSNLLNSERNVFFFLL